MADRRSWTQSPKYNWPTLKKKKKAKQNKTLVQCPNTDCTQQKMWIWPGACRPALWRFPSHLRCPFCFLFLAGVLIGWLAAPFSSGMEACITGGDVGEKRSGSPSMLDLKGPAGENFRGLMGVRGLLLCRRTGLVRGSNEKPSFRLSRTDGAT